MYPFMTRRSLFDNPDENIGLQPEDFFGLRMAQFDPSQQEVNLPMYQPESRMSDQYSQALQEMPQRENPGKLRKILSMVSGLDEVADALSDRPQGGNRQQGLQVADNILNEPYYKKLEDWKLKTGNLEKGAELENRKNTNARMAEYQSTANLIKQQNADTALRRAEDSASKAKSDFEIKLADLERKTIDAENKLAMAEKTLDSRNANADDDRELRKTQLDAMNARHALDLAQKQRSLDESKSLHEIMRQKWAEENKDRDTRLGQYEHQLGIKTGTEPKTTTTEVKDASGKVTSTRTTTTGKTPNAANPIESKTSGDRVTVYDLKTGKDLATIPKNNVSKLDKTKYGVR